MTSAAIDTKHRNVLTDSQIEMLTFYVSVLEKHNKREDLDEDRRIVELVLHVLTISGFAIITQSAIDNMRETLSWEMKPK